MAKCSECGFIAARTWRTSEFVEIEEGKRYSGEIGSELSKFEPTPVCFINSFNIKEEIEILRKAAHDEPSQDSIGGYIPPHWEIHVKAVLNTERKCQSFRKWQQGFTPKEHKEMADRDRERVWRFWELVLIIAGNLLAAGLAAWLTVYLTRGVN
jgi:hypothetical protein